MKNFQRFRILLTENGKTFQSVCDEIKMSPPGLRTSINKGTLSRDRIIKIALYLGLPEAVVTDAVAPIAATTLSIVGEPHAPYGVHKGRTVSFNRMSPGEWSDWMYDHRTEIGGIVQRKLGRDSNG
jgi:hypothetical protein